MTHAQLTTTLLPSCSMAAPEPPPIYTYLHTRRTSGCYMLAAARRPVPSPLASSGHSAPLRNTLRRQLWSRHSACHAASPAWSHSHPLSFKSSPRSMTHVQLIAWTLLPSCSMAAAEPPAKAPALAHIYTPAFSPHLGVRPPTLTYTCASCAVCESPRPASSPSLASYPSSLVYMHPTLQPAPPHNILTPVHDTAPHALRVTPRRTHTCGAVACSRASIAETVKVRGCLLRYLRPPSPVDRRGKVHAFCTLPHWSSHRFANAVQLRPHPPRLPSRWYRSACSPYGS